MYRLFLFFVMLIVCLATSNVYAQNYSELKTDTLNKFDEKGRKHGWCTEFVNSHFRLTNKKKKATYYRLAYYKNGTKLFFDDGVDYLRKFTYIVKGDTAIKNKIILMNGIYQVYYKTGELFHETFYEKGKKVYTKTYFKNGKLSEYIDCVNKYNDNFLSTKATFYNPDGTFFEGYWVWNKNKVRWISID